MTETKFVDDEMLEGYRDGYADDRTELPEGFQRSPAYVHGWRNGRDDRMGKARAPAATLRVAARALKEHAQ